MSESVTTIEATPTQHRCPECEAPFDTPMRLGLHRKRAHNVEGKSRNAKSARRRRSDANTERPTIVRGIRRAAEDLGGGTNVKTPPTAAQLTEALGRGLFTVSTTVATGMVETDPLLPTDELKEQMIDYLSLTRRAAEDVTEPIGRAFAGTALNKRYGRAIVNNVDVVSSVSELTLLAFRYRRYFAIRAEVQRQITGGALPAAPQPSAPPPAAPTTNGTGPREGKVWTIEDVQAMRREQSG